MIRQIKRWLIAASWMALTTGLASAQIPQLGPLIDTISPPNFAAPTLGGLQLRTDIQFRDGWRVQRNSVSGLYRLLDKADVRQAWGLHDHVMREFDELAPVPRFTDDRHLVVLLHGALRSPRSFADLQLALEHSGFDVAALSYDSSQREYYEIVGDLAELLDHLDNYNSVSFVTHSLGGLIVRSLLGSANNWRGDIAVSRVVQIAPPNSGSVVADTMSNTLAFRLLYGPTGQQLVSGLTDTLPGIDVPFGIVVGGTGDAEGYNPLIPGDDDGVVAIGETDLAGATDTLRVDALHSFIMADPRTIDAVLRFFEHGQFSGPFN